MGNLGWRKWMRATSNWNAYKLELLALAIGGFLLLGASPTLQAGVSLSGKYSSRTQRDKTFADAPAGMIGDGSTALRSFSVKPTDKLDGVTIEYKAKFSGKKESGWTRQGALLSRDNTNIEAVSFRLTGPKAKDYELSYAVSSREGELSGVRGEWTRGVGGPIVFVIVHFASKAELKATGRLSEDAQQDYANSETVKCAESRKSDGAPVTAIVLSAVGGVLGFVYAGPEGAMQEIARRTELVIHM